MFEAEPISDRRYGQLIAYVDRDLVPEVERLVGEEAVKTLEGPRSLWPDAGNPNSPYATGRSKKRFLWRRRGGRVGITNHAVNPRDGYPYPGRVNRDDTFAGGRHHRAIERTISAQWRNITRRVARRRA